MASFDENGKYIKTNWKAGDKITATKLNKIEESIEAVNDNDISRHVEADARLDALEAKDVAHDKEFTNVRNLIADNKAAAELGDYEINSRMQFLENELNEGIEEVHNVAETVDGKIAQAEANMAAQVNQGKADMEAMVAEVEGELDGLHAKDDELSTQLAHVENKSTRTFSIIEFGAKSEIGYDNTENIQNAINALSPGDTLVVPTGTFEYRNELILNKDNVRMEFYGTLKYLGVSYAFTVKGSNIILNNLKIERNFMIGGTIANNIQGVGLRLCNAKKIKVYNPIITGFENGILFDTSNNYSIAYIDIYSPKLAECKIGFNRPIFNGSNGWANEVSVFSGSLELAQYSDLSGTKCINIEAGDGFKFISTVLEYNNYERRIYCNGSNNAFIGCRFEGTNGICDIELGENSRNNQFIACDRLYWQTKIKDDGLYNNFNFPNFNKTSTRDRIIYVDYDNGNDINMGYSEDKPIKTLSRLRDILPQIMNHNYQVFIKDSLSLDFLNLENIRGEGSLTIVGNVLNPEKCSVGYCVLKNIHLKKEVVIKGINSRAYDAEKTYYSNFYFEDINVKAEKLNSTIKSSVGVCAGYNANVYLTESTLSNKNEAITTYGVGACVVVYSNYGDNNNTSLQASGGIIFVGNGYQPNADNNYKTNTGGIISYSGVING